MVQGAAQVQASTHRADTGAYTGAYKGATHKADTGATHKFRLAGQNYRVQRRCSGPVPRTPDLDSLRSVGLILGPDRQAPDSTSADRFRVGYG